MRLSYSSLNSIHQGHEWLNKQMGIQVPRYPFLDQGKDAHRIIQRHVSGIEKDPRLSHIECEFPIVEEVDFDKRCQFQFNVSGGYTIFGYVDGKDQANMRLLEIKTADKPWSLLKFEKSMQRKLYALAHPMYEEAYLITGNKQVEKWGSEPLKLYSLSLTERDRLDAQAWIAKGIAILESGEFTGGLDENGRCTGCFYNMPGYRDIATCYYL